MSASAMPSFFIAAIALSMPSGCVIFPDCPRSVETTTLFAPISFTACATFLAFTWVQWVRKGRGAFGPARNWRKQISITAPMSATCFACAMVRPGTLVRACVTIMFFTPSSRPRRTTAMTSSGCTCPVARSRFSRAMIFRIASISGVTWPLGATMRPLSVGLPKVLTCLSDSKVGSQTTLPRLPYTRCIHSTASGLMPPTARFSTTPPNTSMPGTTFITSAARLAVSLMWFFSRMPRIPLAFASCATSMSSMLRPNTSGCECTCMSITPAAGLTFGGGGGKAAWASAFDAASEKASSSTVFMRGLLPVVARKILSLEHRGRPHSGLDLAHPGHRARRGNRGAHGGLVFGHAGEEDSAVGGLRAHAVDPDALQRLGHVARERHVLGIESETREHVVHRFGDLGVRELGESRFGCHGRARYALDRGAHQPLASLGKACFPIFARADARRLVGSGVVAHRALVAVHRFAGFGGAVPCERKREDGDGQLHAVL